MDETTQAGGDAGPITLDDAKGLLAAARAEQTPEQAPAPAAAPEQDAPAQGAEAPEPSGEGAPTDEGTPEPEPAPAIEPPKSWSAADQEAFKRLPPDVQAIVARRESERDRAFQQRAMEAAEIRRAAQAQAAEIEAERQRYAQTLAYVGRALEHELAEEPDWPKLAQENPTAYIQVRAQWDAKVAKLNQVLAEQQQIAAQQQALALEQVRARQVEENARLLAAIPEWKDPAKIGAGMGEIVAYMRGQGYTDQELKGLSDHREVVLIRKAMLFDKAQEAAKTAARKPVPTVQKPGTPPTRGEAGAATRDALIQRVERTGDLKDAVALLRANRSR
ncbi:MAG TPA: hypothetical protein VEY95_11950 [Azospirillaceae bacterium]|nr:hypothetical protein [Azospirillaceae bacterium]